MEILKKTTCTWCGGTGILKIKDDKSEKCTACTNGVALVSSDIDYEE